MCHQVLIMRQLVRSDESYRQRNTKLDNVNYLPMKPAELLFELCSTLVRLQAQNISVCSFLFHPPQHSKPKICLSICLSLSLSSTPIPQAQNLSICPSLFHPPNTASQKSFYLSVPLSFIHPHSSRRTLSTSALDNNCGRSATVDTPPRPLNAVS